MKKSIITPALLALPALTGIAAAAGSPVYPTPQEINLQQQYTQVQTVTVIKRGAESKGGAWERIPADKEGAYSISITPGKAAIYANDDLGLYYAKQTLTQLLRGVADARNPHRDPYPDQSLEQIARKGELPLCEITDWPDLPFRGTVEGYYGAPWSQQARIAQFEFYGRNKMNLYIYAPKDDPYHHGAGCYKPYPADKAAQLAELVSEARKNHVRFVWAIHPANTINWKKNEGRDDMDRLCSKLQQMYDLGVRDFGVFVDDASGEIGKAERQVTLCSYLMEHFIRKHPDVHQGLIMCPTGYNRAWANQQYLNTLGEGLDKNISIMWTGNSVVHDITLEGQKWVNQRVKRPTFIWWNWPVNDYKRSRLCMGRTYGLGQEKEMLTEMSGFAANPMEQAEASKVALFSIADYTWNIAGFDSVPSWQEGIRRQYPQTHQAVQIFCNHNSYLLPNAHGHVREESVNMAPAAQALKKSLKEGKVDAQAATALQTEYENIEKAASAIASGTDTALLLREIQPWVTQFGHLGQAGSDLMTALMQAPGEERTQTTLKAARTLNQMRTVTRTDWSPRGVTQKRGVEVAMKEMTPAAQAAFDKLNTELYAALSGRSVSTLKPVFICQGGNPSNNPGSMTDGNLKTYWASGLQQKPGMWYGYDFGEPIDIKTINLAMGGPRGTDYFEEGQLEISLDGKQWEPIGHKVGGATVAIDMASAPVKARMLRFRITKPHQKYWMGINEFSVNKTMDALAMTSMPGLTGISTFSDSKMIGINRVMEVTTCQPGDSVRLTLAEPVKSTWLEANLGNSKIKDWATIEVVLEDDSVVKPKFHVSRNGETLSCYGEDLPTQRIKSMHLINTGTETQEIKLNVFKTDIPPVDPDHNPKNLLDADFSTAFSSENPVELTLKVPAGATEAIVVGDAACSIVNAETESQAGENIRRFTLPAGATSVTLKAAAQPGKWIQEVIFK